MAVSSPPGTPSHFARYAVALGVGAAFVGLLEQYNPRLALGLALVMLLGVGLLARSGSGRNAFAELGELLQQAEHQLPALTRSPSGTPPAAPAPTGSGGYAFPLQGYAGAVPTAHWDNGLAVDLMAPAGTPWIATTSGVVQAGYYRDGGNTATLYGNDGRVYYYAHGQAPAVSGPVQAGQVIGAVGNTGSAANTPPHLHFALSQGGFGISSQGTGNIPPWDWLRALLTGR